MKVHTFISNFFRKKDFSFPLKDLSTGNIYISSQNHGYVVVDESIDKSKAETIFINVNDGTVEGIQYLNKNIFTDAQKFCIKYHRWLQRIVCITSRYISFYQGWQLSFVLFPSYKIIINT